MYKILVSGGRKTKRDKGIDAWFTNTLHEPNYYVHRKSYFTTSKYKQYLCGDELVNKCFKLYLDDIWNDLDRTQNNFTHGNGRKFLIANNSLFADKECSEILLNKILKDIYMVTSWFLSVLILIEPNYIASSDYIDYLECELIPPEDSQYWIAPIVQKYIDEYVGKIHSELKSYLRNNNPNGMEII